MYESIKINILWVKFKLHYNYKYFKKNDILIYIFLNFGQIFTLIKPLTVHWPRVVGINPTQNYVLWYLIFTYSRYTNIEQEMVVSEFRVRSIIHRKGIFMSFIRVFFMTRVFYIFTRIYFTFYTHIVCLSMLLGILIFTGNNVFISNNQE